MGKVSVNVEYAPCLPKLLPRERWIEAAKLAIEEWPANQLSPDLLARLEMLPMPQEEAAEDEEPPISAPQRMAILTGKRWNQETVKRLTVGFLDGGSADLRARILSHANAWSSQTGIKFVETQNAQSAIIRILRAHGGYWSYMGVDNRQIPAGQQTMNLEGFTMQTSEAEYKRVVRHEFGHALGAPHEHMRPEIVAQLDPAKTIAWGRSALGWSAQMVREQILTPVKESDLIATPHADELSIMCYSFPGSITKDGQPIIGGADINGNDYALARAVYPGTTTPPDPKPPEPPEPGGPVSPGRQVVTHITLAVRGGEITKVTVEDVSEPTEPI